MSSVRVNPRNLYFCILTYDIGNSVEKLIMQPIISSQIPDIKLVQSYFERAYYPITNIVSIQPHPDHNDFELQSEIDVEKPLFWTNDLDLMTKRIYEAQKDVFRIEENELMRILDTVQDTHIDLEDKHKERRQNIMGMADIEMEME